MYVVLCVTGNKGNEGSEGEYGVQKQFDIAYILCEIARSCIVKGNYFVCIVQVKIIVLHRND